jgi:hypothetical protein
MAATGSTPISLYYSATASNVPTAGNLVAGELAINTADGKLFYKDSSGVVQTIASKATGAVAGSTTQVIYNNAGAYAGSANLTFDGTNLGVGTAPTSYSGYTTLALNNATNGGLLDIQIGGTRVGSFQAGSSTELRMYAASSVATTLYAGGSERMRIDSSGNVGIGTSSPATFSAYTKLSVLNGVAVGVDASNAGRIVGSTTSGTELSYLTMGGNYNLGSTGEVALCTQSAKSIIFGTNGTERLRIDSTGNVTLSPTDSRINGGTTAGRMIMANSDTTCYAIAYGSASGTPAQFVVVTNTNKVTTINGTGNLVLTGGTAAASGVGVTFPATQVASSDANCLDDYEEGTWTPSIGGNATYTTQDGRYTKIGNFVKIRFLLSVNVKGTGSATTITGIPFAPSAASPTITGGVVCYATNLAVSANILGIYCQNSGNIYFFTRDGAGTGATTQQPAVIGNSFAAYCELSYMID